MHSHNSHNNLAYENMFILEWLLDGPSRSEASDRILPMDEPQLLIASCVVQT